MMIWKIMKETYMTYVTIHMTYVKFLGSEESSNRWIKNFILIAGSFLYCDVQIEKNSRVWGRYL